MLRNAAIALGRGAGVGDGLGRLGMEVAVGPHDQQFPRDQPGDGDQGGDQLRVDQSREQLLRGERREADVEEADADAERGELPERQKHLLHRHHHPSDIA